MKSPKNIIPSTALFATIAVFFIPMSSSFASDTEPVGYVTGTIVNRNQYPLVGATVLVVGTNCGAMTNPDGKYIFSLPPGYHILNARMVGMGGERSGYIQIFAGDTVKVDFELDDVGWGSRVSRGEWQEYREDSPFILEIRLLREDNLSMDGLTVCSRGNYCRESRISDNFYRIYYPLLEGVLFYCFPSQQEKVLEGIELGSDSLAEVAIDVTAEIPADLNLCDRTSIFPLGMADLTNNEWVAPGYDLGRILINPAEWGHDSLAGYGYIDSRVYFDQNEDDQSWRIVMVFHRKVVVLSENSPPVEYPLDVPTLRADFSPEGRYVLIFDCIGLDYRDGDAVLLDTDTGNSIRFDPTPEFGEPDSIIYSPTIITVSPECTYLPADDGSLISLIDDSIRIYDRRMNLSQTRSFEGIEFFSYRVMHHQNYRLRAPNGDRIIAIGKYDDEYRIFIIDRNGFIQECRSFYPGYIHANTEITVIIFTSNHNGVSVYNGFDGSLLWNLYNDRGCCNPAISPDGNLVGYTLSIPYDSLTGGTSICEIRNVDDEEIVGNFLAHTDKWEDGKIIFISDNGSCLVRMALREDNATRFALLSASNELIWLGPLRFNNPDNARFKPVRSAYPYNDLCALSSDGRRFIYSDGYFIHVMTLTEITD